MKIAIVGTGYVGLVSGACFAEMGLDITCVDIDAEKIKGLNAGVIPIYEPGLEELVRRNVEAGRLHFTTDLTECLPHVEVVFSAVGTPPDEDGSADLKYVLDVARTFGRHIRKYTVLVTKSTVPVGTAQKVRAVIEEELEKRGCKVPFDVASNKRSSCRARSRVPRAWAPCSATRDTSRRGSARVRASAASQSRCSGEAARQASCSRRCSSERSSRAGSP